MDLVGGEVSDVGRDWWVYFVRCVGEEGGEVVGCDGGEIDEVGTDEGAFGGIVGTPEATVTGFD